MILFVALALCSSCLAEDALREVLRSPKATLDLYNDFKLDQGLQSAGVEDRFRFRLFRKNAEFIATINEDDEGVTEYGLNMFSAMTEEEKGQYLGLNVTGHEHEDRPMFTAPAGFSAPESKLWTNEGAVTAVKNQGRCGSCWTFGAVGGLESRYKVASGKLRSFAEQEYLDCVYEGKRDGCKGGWPSDCYTYSKKAGGRLAAASVYKYAGRDGTCKGSSMPDAMVSAKISGFTNVGTSESANIQALAVGSLAVAFEVTSKFQQYRGGIMRDTTCRGRANHAVTSVGYTKNFVLVKNSWGSSWGDNGFVKFARGYSNCGLFKYSSFPTLSKTGKTDTAPSDKATPYRPSDDDKPDPGPKPDPDCKDRASNCKSYHCKYDNIAEKYCRKTCNKCSDDGKCPPGTVKCPDGVCRHEHMC